MADATALIEMGKRSLSEGDKIAAQKHLLQATEMDETSVDAWLWLASAVDTKEEMRICLENVLVLDEGNQTAQHMINELDRGENVSRPDEGFGTFTDTVPAVDDSPIDTDPFGATFGASSFMGDDSDDSYGAGGPFSADFSFSDTEETPPAPAAPVESPFEPDAEPASTPFVDDSVSPFTETSSPFTDELDSLYDEPEPAAPPPVTSPSFEAVYDDNEEEEEEYDYGYDQYNENEPDYLLLLPDDIEPTRIPGSDEPEPASAGNTLVIVIGVLNVLALAALVAQFIL
jgi:hypothetical protein